MLSFHYVASLKNIEFFRFSFGNISFFSTLAFLLLRNCFESQLNNLSLALMPKEILFNFFLRAFSLSFKKFRCIILITQPAYFIYSANLFSEFNKILFSQISVQNFLFGSREGYFFLLSLKIIEALLFFAISVFFCYNFSLAIILKLKVGFAKRNFCLIPL